ncbi:hypothetical protein ACVQ90_00755 [Staphylococcus aureus]
MSGAPTRSFSKEIVQGNPGQWPQQREIQLPIYTDNASWGGTTK